MTRFLWSVRNVWRREWKRILERKTIYLMTIVLPQLLFVYFLWIYVGGNVRNIPLVVYDGERNEFSRMLVRSFEASGTFQLCGVATNENEIEAAFRSGKAAAALVIPKYTEQNLKSGKEATIVFYTNGTNLILHNTAMKEASTIVRTYSAGILMRKMRLMGLNESQATQRALPIRVDVRPLYNAYYNYAQYIGVGLLPAIFQILIMMVAVLLLSSEFTHNTFGELVATAEGSILAIILGKSLPYLLLHMVTVLGLVGILFPLFHIPVAGSMGALLFLFFLFVGASHSMGLALSSLFHNQQLATEIVFFLNIPAFIFSGYIYPLWAMPWIHRLFAEILPFTHFLASYLQIEAMGLSLVDAYRGSVVLLLFWFFSAAILVAVLKHEIRKQRFE